MRINTSRLAQAVAVGIGATVVMDSGGEVIRRTRGVKPLDYALLGRWIGHMPEGQFRHPAIMHAAPVRHERLLGWAAHYSIGTGFVIVLVAVHPRWLERPTIIPALITGIGTIVAPWFVMQPAFGLGIAAAKTPAPAIARAQSLRTHTIYGLGIWVAANTLRQLRS